jgi:hypothetical protein
MIYLGTIAPMLIRKPSVEALGSNLFFKEVPTIQSSGLEFNYFS